MLSIIIEVGINNNRDSINNIYEFPYNQGWHLFPAFPIIYYVVKIWKYNVIEVYLIAWIGSPPFKGFAIGVRLLALLVFFVYRSMKIKIIYFLDTFFPSKSRVRCCYVLKLLGCVVDWNGEFEWIQYLKGKFFYVTILKLAWNTYIYFI